MKIFKIDLFYLSKHYFLRNDVKFLNYKTSINKNKKYILLKNIFNVINGNSYTEYYTEEKTKIPFIRVGDLSFKDNIEEQDLIYLNEDVKIPNEKILKENDLILATIGTLGKVNLITKKFIGGTFSNNTVLLRLKNKNNNPIFIEKLLQSDYMQSIINKVKAQKAQPNLQTYDLLNIKIPQIPLEAQNKAVEQITPIENKIQELKAQIQDPKTIINEVFAEEFNFNINKFEEIKKINKYYLKLKDIKDFRLSFSYIKNNNSSIYIKNFLIKKDSIYLKNILKKKIKRGIQPEYDENGEIIVIKTLNIQNGNIKYDNEIQFVNNDFFEKYKDRALIEKNDLLLTSTGAGRGKFAIYENNEEAIADSHISIIKLNNKFNIKYINFFCQSLFGENQLKYIETQIKGTPEIQEENLKYFLIPNIPLQKQQEIVDKIQTKINEQNKINDLIEKEREKINYIIENIVNS